MKLTRPNLAGVLAALFLLATLVNYAQRPINPGISTASSLGTNATVLYCTGLSSAKHHEVGLVTFQNTSGEKRSVSISVSSPDAKIATTKLTLGAYRSKSFDPGSISSGSYFGVSAQFNGTGVIAQESLMNGQYVSPCISSGSREWYGAGFDTKVGSLGALSIYNPTGTPAVLNIVSFTPTGYVAPAPFQGLSIPGHAESLIDLGAQIVDRADIAVRVTVLRGSLVIAGVQESGSNQSVMTQSSEPQKLVTYPAVSTAASAISVIRLANSHNRDVTAHVKVDDGAYGLVKFDVPVPAYSTVQASISPNTAIAAGGIASVTITAKRPISTSLVTGTTKGLNWIASTPASSTVVVTDPLKLGYGNLVLANTSNKTIHVTETQLNAGALQTTYTIKAHGTVSFATGTRLTAPNISTEFVATGPYLVATMVRASTPVGIYPIVSLHSR
jgi:Family of unknown function (DUF5719)